MRLGPSYQMASNNPGMAFMESQALLSHPDYNAMAQGGDAHSSYHGDGVGNDDNSTEHSKEHNIMSLSGCFTLASFFITLAFLGLLIYTLINFDTDTVRSACPNLLGFVKIRTILGLMVMTSLFTYSYFSSHSSSSYYHDSREEGRSMCCILSPTLLLVLIILYFLSFSIAGAVILFQSTLDNHVCLDAIQDSTFNMPLLGVLGWIYVVGDTLLLIFAFYVIISPYCVSTSTRKSDPAENI